MALYVPDPDIDLDKLVEDLGRVLAERYANAEDELLREVAVRAYRDVDLQFALQMADTDDRAGLRYAIDRNRALAELAGHRAATLRELQAKALQIVDRLPTRELAQEIVDIASTAGEADAAARIGMASKLPKTTTLTGNASQATTQLALSLQSRLETLNARITRFPQDAYQRIVSLSSTNSILGTTTTLQAQRQAVANFLREGITGFVDKADRRWRIGSYAEMATRTTVARAFNDAATWRMQQSDINLGTIVGSSDACAKCAPWIGRVLSLTGTAGVVTVQHATRDETVTIDVRGTIQDARNAGWGHPNDRCKIVAYSPGLSIPQAGFKYDEAADKARERQREIEVSIRAAKRDLAVAPDDLTARRAKNQIKDRQQQLRDHLSATGRQRNNAREQLAFADG